MNVEDGYDLPSYEEVEYTIEDPPPYYNSSNPNVDGILETVLITVHIVLLKWIIYLNSIRNNEVEISIIIGLSALSVTDIFLLLLLIIVSIYLTIAYKRSISKCLTLINITIGLSVLILAEIISLHTLIIPVEHGIEHKFTTTIGILYIFVYTIVALITLISYISSLCI